jgi:hypothetical protein
MCGIGGRGLILNTMPAFYVVIEENYEKSHWDRFQLIVSRIQVRSDAT